MGIYGIALKLKIAVLGFSKFIKMFRFDGA